MFTGIITDIGRVRAVTPRTAADCRIEIETGFDTAGMALGASVACSGPCLTLVDKGPGWFAVDVSAETLACTTLGGWKPGTPVNLERALRIGDELGGHIVTGHIDGVGALISIESDGDSNRLVIEAPKELARFIAQKGSITLEGVSLTVNEVAGRRFGVNIIPHTLGQTTLGVIGVGAGVNLEIDVLARYVARLHASED